MGGGSYFEPFSRSVLPDAKTTLIAGKNSLFGGHPRCCHLGQVVAFSRLGAVRIATGSLPWTKSASLGNVWDGRPRENASRCLFIDPVKLHELLEQFRRGGGIL